MPDLRDADLLRRCSQRLNVLRLARGLTQQQVAELTGLTQQAISYIERGVGTPRLTSIVRIARALGTTVDSLCGVRGDEHPAVPTELGPSEFALGGPENS